MNKKISNDMYEDSYNSREGSGGSKRGVMDWKKSGKKFEFYKPVEGSKNLINIIPYVIKSKLHPRVRAGKSKVGDLAYNLDVWIHKGIGPNKQDVICPKRTYGGSCPICDQAHEFYENEQKKEYDNIKAKHRVFYNVLDMNNFDKGIMVFEASHPLFEKELIEAVKDASEGGQFIPFADIDDGVAIKFKAVTETFGKNTYFEFKNFQLTARNEPLDESLTDDTVSFDECMTVLDTEAINNLLFGNGDDVDDEEDEDEVPVTPPPKKPVKRAEAEEPKEEPTKPVCPHKHKFGADCDKFDDCDDCRMYKACSHANDE